MHHTSWPRHTLAAIACAALLAALLPAVSARAAGQVGSGTPQSCTESALRSAVAGGGAVSFSCGAAPVTIALTQALAVKSDTTIDGGGPAQGGLVTLDGGGQTTVMTVDSGVRLTLQNLTIANGRDSSATTSTQAGGLWVNGGASVTVVNSRFVNNNGAPGGTERGGGAIATGKGASLTVRDTEFSGNAGVNGGAINLLLSSATVEGSIFSDNSALTAATDAFITGFGGAIYMDGASIQGDGQAGQLIIRTSTFQRNRARAQGGAVFSFGYEGDSTLVDGSMFVQNVAGSPGEAGLGGAIRHGNGPLTVQDSTFSLNTAYGNGGAVQAAAVSDGRFVNVTLSGNRAEAGPGGRASYGGALALTEGAFTVTNSTIAGNSAYSSAGAIMGGSTPIQFDNNILENNGTTLDAGYARQCTGKLQGGHNMQWPSFAADFSGCVSGIAAASAQLGALGANGGQVATLALAAGSPAADAGDPARCPLADARGADRVGACDIGAFELGGTPAATPAPNTPALSPIANGGSPILFLTWTRVGRATSYQVEFAPGGQSQLAAASTVSTTAGELHYALGQGAYQVRVRACNWAGCSAYSAGQALSITSDPSRAFLPTVVR